MSSLYKPKEFQVALEHVRMLLESEAKLAVTSTLKILDHGESIQKHFIYHDFGVINAAILISVELVETKLVYGNHKVPLEVNEKLESEGFNFRVEQDLSLTGC
jgi:hypothetical protein